MLNYVHQVTVILRPHRRQILFIAQKTGAIPASNMTVQPNFVFPKNSLQTAK